MSHKVAWLMIKITGGNVNQGGEACHEEDGACHTQGGCQPSDVREEEYHEGGMERVPDGWCHKGGRGMSQGG